jgi:hypothetical protein
MHKYVLTVILLLGLTISGLSQELWFTNTAKNKVIKASIGTTLYITYNGYNGQHEYATQIITDITDSTVTLGVNPQNGFLKKSYSARANQHKVIYLKDITAFRKRGLGGIVLQSAVKISVAVGSVFLLNSVYTSNNISTGNALLISAGTGIAAGAITKLIFPENAKNKMADGWNVRTAWVLD